MSRAQQGAIEQTATANSAADTAKSNTSLDTAQTDINNYGSAVNKFAAANPYVEGGQAETATNQQSADTAAGLAQSAGQGIQSAAVRTGQNAGGAIAATEEMQQQNERALVGQEAKSTEDRLASGTTYQDAVLGDQAKQQGMQEQLGTAQANIAQGQLNTGEDAAKTPSFMDELGQGLITTGVNAGKAFLQPGCWIAAELYGGWEDPRTTLVRSWLFTDFSHRWYGAPLCWLYMLFGERMAERIKTRPRLRSGFQWLFNKALKAASKPAVNHGR